MTNFLKLLGIWAFAAAIIFFNAWCLNLIYVSVVPLFAKFAVALPELTYGVFVLIELVLSFIVSLFRKYITTPKEDYATMFANILTHELALLIYAACAVWASSVVFS
jgi:hypothetical protein